MHRHFEDELSALRDDLLYMASLAEQSVSSAIQALIQRDAELASKVIQEDRLLNELEVKIDNQCIQLFALHQVVASDLRFIASSMKINNDLERIGDHAVNIAEKVLELIKEPQLKPLIDIPRMAELAQGMVKDALDAFLHKDTEKAIQVCERDDQVDALDDQVLRELLTYMSADPKTIPRALALIMISKNLERVADLSTNIAEEVVFIVEARTIKHHLADRNKSQGEE